MSDADQTGRGQRTSIERLDGSAPWEARYGYCRVVIAGGWAVTAGTTATGPAGVLHVGNPYEQTRAAFGIALQTLSAAGVAREQVVRTRMYVTAIQLQEEVGRAHRDVFTPVLPVATVVQVVALADPDHLVEVEVEAYLG